MIMQGVGNCVQGLIDAVLYVAFTPAIRNNFIKMFFCRGRLAVHKPTRLDKESKNYYDHYLRNSSPRYSLYSSSPVNISSTRISATPEPSTSFQESPGSRCSIQNEQTVYYDYY